MNANEIVIWGSIAVILIGLIGSAFYFYLKVRRDERKYHSQSIRKEYPNG